MTGVLFVCLGNICRSPAAEAIFAKYAFAQGLEVQVDSAGTGSWHVGERPYGPMREAARARGYDLEGLRARQFRKEDFERFDLIIAMDGENLRALEAMCPPHALGKLHLMMEFAPMVGRRSVPDPYYTRRFDETITLIEQAVEGLVQQIAVDTYP